MKSGFTLSGPAESDLAGIAEYTLEHWGERQTDQYLNKLEPCCRLLAENPMLGRPCDTIRQGLRRFEHGEHVVYHRPSQQSIYVVRILHRSMLPRRHLRS